MNMTLVLSHMFTFFFAFVITGALFLIYYFARLSPLVDRNHILKTKLKKERHERYRVEHELMAVRQRLMEAGKMSTLASLSAGIVHQLSQPATAIYGMMKFLRKELGSHEQYGEAVNLVQEQSAYLKDMLDDFMEIVRHKEVVKTEIDLNEVVRKSIKLLSDEIRIARVKMDLSLQTPLPPIKADSVFLQQVFMNLVVNALQAMRVFPRTRERKLTIVSSVQEMGKMVQIQCTNDSPPLTNEQLESMFEPFYSTKAKGAGIGLALCKGVVEDHGGNISVSSDEGGTTFTMTFPVSAAATASF